MKLWHDYDALLQRHDALGSEDPKKNVVEMFELKTQMDDLYHEYRAEQHRLLLRQLRMRQLQ